MKFGMDMLIMFNFLLSTVSTSLGNFLSNQTVVASQYFGSINSYFT